MGLKGFYTTKPVSRISSYFLPHVSQILVQTRISSLIGLDNSLYVRSTQWDRSVKVNEGRTFRDAFRVSFQ